MKPVVLALPGNEELGKLVLDLLDAEWGQFTFRKFPDGETYIKIDSPLQGRLVILICTLHGPDEIFLPLYLFSSTAKDLGAVKVILVAPYLSYMRQDQRFHPGEGISSRYFGRLISGFIDGLVTVDPHLHRYRSLIEIYSIPTQIIHAAPEIARWIRENILKPVLIGPDQESEQWVQEVAKGAGAPYRVLDKVRRGDRNVEVSLPPWEKWRDHTPVIVDDIISSAHTMMETIRHLKAVGAPAPVCVGVHAVFSENAYEDLLASGTSKVVTCNTISHPSNQIDLSRLLVEGMKEMLSL